MSDFKASLSMIALRDFTWPIRWNHYADHCVNYQDVVFKETFGYLFSNRCYHCELLNGIDIKTSGAQVAPDDFVLSFILRFIGYKPYYFKCFVFSFKTV